MARKKKKKKLVKFTFISTKFNNLFMHLNTILYTIVHYSFAISHLGKKKKEDSAIPNLLPGLLMQLCISFRLL